MGCTPRRKVLAVALVMASTLLASCTSDTKDADNSTLSADQVAARYGYTVGQEELTPSYALVPQFDDPRDLYARALLAQQCLSGVVDIEVVVPRPSTNLDAFDSRTNQRNFNEAIAAQWGYVLPPASPLANQGASPADLQVTPEIEQAYADCGEAANERLGLPPARPVQAVLDAGWLALETSTEYDRAKEEWVQCMAPAGVIDLPRDPHDMPSPSVLADGGVDSTDDRTVPSERERQVAITDAQCRASTAFNYTELEVRAVGELEAIGGDVEAFESSRQQYEVYEQKIDQVIEELG